MKRSLTASAAVLLALALALATVSVAGAGGTPQKRTIKVEDDFFSPTKFTVNRGSTISFKWPETSDTHDVLLEKGPTGVKKFSSPEIAGSSFVYKAKLTKPGKYMIVCTLHETEMRATVTVRK